MRRNFPDKVKAAIVHRAMNADGRIVCEGCGLVLGKKLYHIDHTIPEAMVVDKSRKHYGYQRKTSRPVDGSRASRFKKKMNGNVELR